MGHETRLIAELSSEREHEHSLSDRLHKLRAFIDTEGTAFASLPAEEQQDLRAQAQWMKSIHALQKQFVATLARRVERLD